MHHPTVTSEAPAPSSTRRPLWASSGASTNRLATASVVLGLLWLGGVGSAAAIVCGHWAHHQIGERWQRGKDRATLGIRLGWLGIMASGVVVVLMVATPEQLAHQLDQVERMVRRIF